MVMRTLRYEQLEDVVDEMENLVVISSRLKGTLLQQSYKSFAQPCFTHLKLCRL